MLRIGASRLGADVAAQRQVKSAFQRLTESNIKLATLKRINQGRDDPAGLIAAEALHLELTALEEASAASERTRALVHVADSGLERAGALLNDIQGLMLSGVGDAVSPAEKKAIQLEIDAAIDGLDRLGATTSFAGKRLFSGDSLQFLTGPSPDQVETLDLPELNSGALGSSGGLLSDLRSGGSASLDAGDPQVATEILDAARSEILSARATAGAFERYAIDATQEVLADTSVNLGSALSHIADTDVAAESSRQVRAMILSESALNTARLTLANRRMTAGLLGGILAP